MCTRPKGSAAITSIDYHAANRIAFWTGSGWTAAGSGVDGDVYALANHEGRLVAGGAFLNAGGAPASRIALWDGATWNALGSGVDSTVYALYSLHSRLYVGGDFTTAGGNPSFSMAQWDEFPEAVPEATAGAHDVLMRNPYAPGGVILLGMAPEIGTSAAIFDLEGGLVRRLPVAVSGAPLTWDGRNEAGTAVPSGRYFLRASTGTRSAARSFVLIR